MKADSRLSKLSALLSAKHNGGIRSINKIWVRAAWARRPTLMKVLVQIFLCDIFFQQNKFYYYPSATFNVWQCTSVIGLHNRPADDCMS
ncbi:hypothetical protein M513_06070 [Trichuris suis]|uniref:Uncharacterized protein n=1 Tax=Trichuris suis TaxID=68888 RepID=A0A085M6V8_9BILA|nr:hypothetical protein M513_06070 [Trichuris suis]